MASSVNDHPPSGAWPNKTDRSSSLPIADNVGSLKSSKESTTGVFKVTPLSMFINNKVGSSFSISHQPGLLDYHQPIVLPVLPVTGRKVRDSGSLLIMFAFLGFLGYIIWDGLVVKETDVNLIVHGHDSYGNICGRNNKPIKSVEKSGKNMTDKPFTKYTLINSQFERYTLDSDRLRHGELIYVKQQEQQRASSIQRRLLPGRGTSRADSTENRDNHQPSLTAPPHRVIRSAPAPSDALQRELHLKRNQSRLNELKSALMYQYPPMYGYSPPKLPTTGQQLSSTVTSRPRDGDERQMNRNALGSREADGLNPDALPAESLAVSSAAQTSTSTTTGAPVTLISRRTTLPTVMFDDRASDSDRFSHTMLHHTQYLSSRASESASGINLNEVSISQQQQLLYLTECVDYCPSQDHVELIFYRCMPKNWRFSLFPNAINVTRTFIDDILTDMSHCYRELIYIFSLALVLSLALLILLRFLASFIIWSCLVFIIMLFLSMTSYSWITYYNQIVDLNNLMPQGASYSDRMASSDKWLVGSIFLTFISFAVIGIVMFMRRRILLVTSLFKESGKAIADMPLLLLQPVLTFAALVSITLIWSLGLVCLQSIKDPMVDMSTGFVVYKADTLYKIMKWYHIFAFLWVSHFAIACQHYVIGAAVSKWYFSTDRYNLHSPIGTSVSELILYYLGSVALGSFLVAIFKVIRIITRQIQFLVQRNCMSQTNGPDPSTGVTNFQLSTSCCGSFGYIWRLFIWFFDNIVMIINRDAYVEIAIHGHSFLEGAQQAFKVLASNPLKLLAIKSVSNVLLIVAKICVVFGSVSMAVVLLEEKTVQLNYAWSPLIVTAVFAYIVSHWFLSVYEMVIDALFICYCEDYERSKNKDLYNQQVIGSNFMTQILSSGNY